jgi:large subunit ribosomal protein L10
MGDEVLTVDQIESIARLPARDVLHGQLVGTIASPLTGLVRGLTSLISGLAIQLKQIEEQGLVGGGEAATSEQETESGKPDAEEAPAEEPAPEPSEAPGDPAAEAEAAEAEAAESEASPEGQAAEAEAPVEEPAAEQETETPSEGEETEEKEG